MPARFVDKLSALAEKCTSDGSECQIENYLAVRNERRFLGLLTRNRVFAHVWVAQYDDHWRVMLSAKPGMDGPFWGADFSLNNGDDADSCLLGVWKRESNEWQRCISTEVSTICQRIEQVIDLAYGQYVES